MQALAQQIVALAQQIVADEPHPEGCAETNEMQALAHQIVALRSENVALQEQLTSTRGAAPAAGSDAGAKRAAGGTHTGGNAAKRARAMEDKMGDSGAAGGEEEEGDSTQRAVPDEAARAGSSSTRERGRREEADAAGAGAAKKKKPHSVCPHQRRRDRCKECGGQSICEEHQRQRSSCKECGGASVCEHQPAPAPKEPFFPSAGRGTTQFWGKKQGPAVFLWESLDEEGRKECEETMRMRKDWVVWSQA